MPVDIPEHCPLMREVPKGRQLKHGELFFMVKGRGPFIESHQVLEVVGAKGTIWLYTTEHVNGACVLRGPVSFYQMGAAPGMTRVYGDPINGFPTRKEAREYAIALAQHDMESMRRKADLIEDALSRIKVMVQ